MPGVGNSIRSKSGGWLFQLLFKGTYCAAAFRRYTQIIGHIVEERGLRGKDILIRIEEDYPELVFDNIERYLSTADRAFDKSFDEESRFIQ